MKRQYLLLAFIVLTGCRRNIEDRLVSRFSYIRNQAVQEFESLDVDQKDAATRKLAETLDRSSGDVKLHATEALVHAGPSTVVAAPELVKAVHDPSSRIRRNAVEALRNIQPADRPVVAACISALEDPSTDVVLSACDSLAVNSHGYWRAAHALISKAKTSDARVRQHAINALGYVGPAFDDVFPTLVGGLTDPSAAVRRSACGAFAHIGEPAKDQAENLFVALNDQDLHVREACAIALGEIGNFSAVVVERLQAASADASPEVDRAVANALNKLRVAELRQGLADSDPGFRIFAIQRIVAMKDAGSDATPDLISILENDRDNRVPAVAAYALGSLGPDASAAVPNLIKALGSSNKLIQQETAGSLRRLNTPESQAALANISNVLAPATIKGSSGIDLSSLINRRLSMDESVAKKAKVEMMSLSDEDKKALVPLFLDAMRKGAQVNVAVPIIGPSSEALVELGPVVIPQLVPALEDPNHAIRTHAAWIIGSNGSAAAYVGDALLKAVRRDPTMNADVVVAFGEIGSAYTDSIPYLMEVLEYKNAGARSMGATALGKIGPAASVASDKLAAMVDNDPWDLVRCSAAEALGKIGSGAKSGVPALIRALDYKHDYLKRNAYDALQKIGTPEAMNAIQNRPRPQ